MVVVGLAWSGRARACRVHVQSVSLAAASACSRGSRAVRVLNPCVRCAAVISTGGKGATLALFCSVLGTYGSVVLPSIDCASPVARSVSLCESNLAGVLPNSRI